MDAVESNYNQGSLGFINWMLSKENIPTDQLQDLNAAYTIIKNASEEDFLEETELPEDRAGKVIVVGDQKDATSLENLKNPLRS